MKADIPVRFFLSVLSALSVFLSALSVFFVRLSAFFVRSACCGCDIIMYEAEPCMRIRNFAYRRRKSLARRIDLAERRRKL